MLSSNGRWSEPQHKIIPLDAALIISVVRYWTLTAAGILCDVDHNLIFLPDQNLCDDELTSLQ